METVLRQLAMLQQIPRHPRRIDTGTIRQRLVAQGFKVTLRTVQRDLNALAAVLPIQGDESKPQGWYWAADASVHQLPGLDPQTALVFRMAEEHLRAVLPASTVDLLGPWFKAARGVLTETGKDLGQWPNKVRVLPRGMPLLPPQVSPLVQDAVYQAVLEERRLHITYRSRNTAKPRAFDINPLALISREPATYLVATLARDAKPRLLLLHRILTAKILEEPATPPAEFDLDRFIANGELGYRLGPPIRLQAEFSSTAAKSLFETPLAVDQTVEPMDGNRLLISATVADTFELRAWLRGFGKEVRIVEPVGLLD